MEDGWIKLHRKMREWQHYQRPSVRLVFEELLFCANTKAGWFHGIKVNRGETIVSIETICTYTGFARATVVAALKILEETKEIKRSKCWRGTRTKIINFDKYQDNGSSESSSKSELQTELLIEHQSELQTELLIEPKQELKKEKKEKNNIDANASSSGAAAPDPDLSSQESVDFVGLIKFFNRTMEEAGAIIPRCKSCDGKRREFVRARIREHGLDAVYEMITKASQSDFLNGKSRSGWIADFTWLFRPSNFQKVLEGNYDNRNNHYQPQINGANQFTDPRQAEREQLARGYAAVVARRLAEDDAREAELRQP
jgi:hypothetical protein